MTDRAHLIARLRRAAAYHTLCDEAADALSAPAVTEEVVERVAEKIERYGLWSTDPAVAHRAALPEGLDVARERKRQYIRTVLSAAAALARPAVTAEMIDALRRLLNFAGAAAFALEESETREDEVSVDLGMFGEAAAALERLEELPDDQPGYTMSGVAKAEWALRAILTDALGADSGAATGAKNAQDRVAEATAAERESAVERMNAAYSEWWRLGNEHGERFAAWKRGGEKGPMPESRLGSLPDYLAAAIRGGGND